MTIEIKQLVLRAVVDTSREAVGHPRTSGSGSEPQPSPLERSVGLDKVDLDALRNACLRELRREIRKTRER